MESKRLELFDLYTHNNLSETEKSAFDQKLVSDTEFKKQFEEYKLMVGGIQLAAIGELKSKLVAHESGFKESVNTKASSSLVFKIAASLVFLVAATFLVINYTSNDNYDQLYSEYYSPYPNIVDPVSRSDQNGGQSIFQLYEAGKYDEVLAAVSQQTANEDELFYLAQAYLALDQTDEAISTFKKTENESRYYQAAQWYIALGLLQRENLEQLEKQLNQIIDFQGDYSRRAAELLDKL